MNNVLFTYLAVGIFLIAGLIFAILVKPEEKKKHDTKA
jgi:ABC-type sugar transport system permease subunit